MLRRRADRTIFPESIDNNAVFCYNKPYSPDAGPGALSGEPSPLPDREAEGGSMFSETLLRQRLAERGLDIPLFFRAETASTNSDAKAFAQTGSSSPVLFAAEKQSAGRGRQGKSFLSPPGGLYMSLLVPTDSPLAEAIGVTGCAAVAACRAVEAEAGIPARIKWVNDILAEDGRGGYGKAAGILCEAVSDGERARCLVIGIGVNVTAAPEIPGANFPPIALSRAGHPAEPERLCARLTEELLKAAAERFDFRTVAGEYRERSIVKDREIVFIRDGAARTGKVLAILDDGSLLVSAGGEKVILNSGEISVIPL